MKIPDYARYDYCVKRSYEFLEEYNIFQFPLKPLEIIKANKWRLFTYSELSNKFECSVEDTTIALGTYDGLTMFNDSEFIIAYNDTKYKKRILFTLMHEIGHIYLNHLIDFNKTSISRELLTDKEYTVLENEADAFARNCLAPAMFVLKLNKKHFTAWAISTQFGISNKAAKTRLNLLSADIQCVKNIGYESRFMRLYQAFYYRQRCLDCNAIININNTKYCHICGSKKIEKGNGTMHYKEYEVHKESNKLKKCLKCDNENTDIEGLYCQICGDPLINKCDDRNLGNGYDSPCGEIVPSNARYCPYCSHPTIFLNDNVLKDWKEEAGIVDKMAEIESQLPDTLDIEEMPFI